MVLPVFLVGGLVGRVSKQTSNVGISAVSGLNLGGANTRLKYGGKRIQRLLKKTDTDTLKAAMRASNRSGMWGKTQVLRSLAKLLGVQKRYIRSREYKASLGSKRSHGFYRLIVWRNYHKVERLKGTKFRASKGQPNLGTLRFTTYGKKQVFKNVLNFKGRFYLTARGGSDVRRIFGTWINADYKEPAQVKADIPARWVAEFDRQLALAKSKRRRRR